MKRTKHMSSHLGGFNSGASLGGKVSRYRDKQNIYKQGEPAYTLFYIQSGGEIGRAHVWNSSHGYISYAVFCLKKKNTYPTHLSTSPFCVWYSALLGSLRHDA